MGRYAGLTRKLETAPQKTQTKPRPRLEERRTLPHDAQEFAGLPRLPRLAERGASQTQAKSYRPDASTGNEPAKNAAEAMERSRRNHGEILRRAKEIAAVKIPQLSGVKEQGRKIQVATMPDNAGVTTAPGIFVHSPERLSNGVWRISVTVAAQDSVTKYNSQTKEVASQLGDAYVPERTLDDHEAGHALIFQRFRGKFVEDALRQAKIEGEVQANTAADVDLYVKAIFQYLASYRDYISNRALHQEAVLAGDPTYTQALTSGGKENASYVPHQLDVEGNVLLEMPRFMNPLTGEEQGPTERELQRAYEELTKGVPHATKTVRHAL